MTCNTNAGTFRAGFELSTLSDFKEDFTYATDRLIWGGAKSIGDPIAANKLEVGLKQRGLVWWSACLPPTLTIQVKIPLKCTFFCKYVHMAHS